MQAQSIKQNTITSSQSLQIVQTLLRAGFGCVTYLRGLLPDENFTESHINSSSGVSPSSSQESNLASVRLKAIKKGWSTEGDRLLQYLEKGIFDALEKQYLRSFIFAIYLDEKNPENLIEAYTFNFSYCDVPGASVKVPIMTLNDQLDGLSLDTNNTKGRDPVIQAIHQGKQPTLNELKQSVKYLIRKLIAAVQTLNPLPSRRFVTFKLFYMDGIPDDYEPPYFCPGDSGKKYIFCTHSEDEIPENITIGSLRTPHHCLNICVDSISDVIPHEMRNGEKTTPYKDDASITKFVWSAERSVNPLTGNYQPSTHEQEPTIAIQPEVNSKPNEMGYSDLMNSYEQTCALSPTQVLGPSGLMTPGVIHSPINDAFSGVNELDMSMGQGCEVTTQALTDFLLKRDANQVASVPHTSFAIENSDKVITNTCNYLVDESKTSDNDVIHCDCGVHGEEEADICQCEGPCQNWFHIWCLGYHSMCDERLPQTFWCFSCRLRNDPEIEILDSKNLTSQYITKYRDLCLFRRAIKIVLNQHPENVSAFTKLLGADLSTAAQTWKRLETEGVIIPKIHEEGAGASRKNKKQENKKGIKRYKYTPARDIESSQKFKDYFNPAAEARLIGMSKFHLHKGTEDKTSGLKVREQTKSNIALNEPMVNKRKTGDYDSLSNKRIKVSIAEAINLDE